MTECVINTLILYVATKSCARWQQPHRQKPNGYQSVGIQTAQKRFRLLDCFAHWIQTFRKVSCVYASVYVKYSIMKFVFCSLTETEVQKTGGKKQSR